MNEKAITNLETKPTTPPTKKSKNPNDYTSCGTIEWVQLSHSETKKE